MKQARLIPLLLLLALSAEAQNRYDVVIDEIMADPAPAVGLPNYEWLELKNTGTTPFNLQNWRIGDATSLSGPLPNFTLQPDSFVIVCSAGALSSLSVYGPTIAITGFPSLDNEGDQLYLRSAGGKTIHAVSYTTGWYRNELKKDGGWTLEMTDTKNPCGGISNWKASISASGGTPGKKNSTDALNNDTEAPQLQRAYCTDNSTIILVFDEPLDSLSAAATANYTIDGGLTLVSATTLAPLFSFVQLKTSSPMGANTIYTITATGVKDCRGNPVGALHSAKTGLAADAAAGEWIINEILFNPRAGAYDYVEFYNNSQKIFDASRLYIANRNSSGAVSSVKALSAVPFLVFPGDYIVETEDAASLALQYLVKNPGQVLVISAAPSFPDDEGDVIALNFQGTVIDEVKYRDDWHFKLISNDEGVSLERIDPAGTSQDPSNWHSAATTAGYGTPTYKNSQFKRMEAINTRVDITPAIFSPDNDGRDDIAVIQYELTEPGFMANCTVFDGAGRPVRLLLRNGLLGLKGNWKWDGLDDRGAALPVGTYIIFTEIFNLQGKRSASKNSIVLARKL